MGINNAKLDFNDLIREYGEKYGLADEDWDGQRKNAILTFSAEKEGDKEERIMARHRGMPVFRNRDDVSKINDGETWICSLDNKGTYYFARGLQRIDASFMYELKRDQMSEIASAIWEKQRHIIEPLLEEKYKEVMEERIEDATLREREEGTSRIEALEEKIHTLEQIDAENKQIISSLQEKIKNQEHRSNTVSAAPGAEAGMLVQSADIHVMRDGPDTISSNAFSSSRYFVHLSADRRTLLVRPHGDGNVVCINNTIVLAGLSLISSFDHSDEMISEYNPKYGGIQIYL